jgi:hypothetical protein
MSSKFTKFAHGHWLHGNYKWLSAALSIQLLGSQVHLAVQVNPSDLMSHLKCCYWMADDPSGH